MAQVRPSLTLILDIDERLDSPELRLEVGRCFTHVSTTLVRTHSAAEGEPENVARLLVKMGTRKYLYSTDEGADELWGDVMERWFANEFHKVGNHLRIFNRRQREIGNPELPFAWMEVELQGGALNARVHLDSTSGIDPANSVLLSTVRSALNDGTLEGESGAPVRVWMPSPASYESIREAGLAAKAQREAEKLARREAEQARLEEERAIAEEQAAEAFLESPELVAEDRGEEDERAAEMRREIEEKFTLPEPDFDIDYTLWQVDYADGSSRMFDSATNAFLD